MIRSKVTKNIISIFLAVVTFFFGIYVSFYRVQAAEVSFVDDTVDYYFDDDGYIHAVYQDHDTACKFKVSDFNQTYFSNYCYVYDSINDLVFLIGLTSDFYDSYVNAFIFNFNSNTLLRSYLSHSPGNYYNYPYVFVAFYDLDISSSRYILASRPTTSSTTISLTLSNFSNYHLVSSDFRGLSSFNWIPLYSNTNWKGTFAVDGSRLSNVPAEYQYNYIYYDPDTTYYTFLTWSVPLGTHYSGTFYSQDGIGTYKIYTSQNGSDWTWHSSGYAGTFPFSSPYLGENISPIYYSDDYGRSGSNNDAFPEDYSIEDTLDNLSHGDFATFLDNKIMCNFTVVDPVNAYTYYPENPYTPDFSLASNDLYIITTSDGYKFFCYDTSSLPAVGSTFRYYFYNDPSIYGSVSFGFYSIDLSSLPFMNGTNGGVYYDYTVASIDHADTLYGFTHLINENLISGFVGLNDTIISLNDNIGSMLSSVHARLGNIYSRLSVTNEFLDSMNGSLSSLNASISNGFDNVISAINDLGSSDPVDSGSVDLSGVEDKISDLNSNVDEWQNQFTGFSMLLWLALGFDDDGEDDPNFPNIIEFIQGAVTGSAIGTALGYFNSFDTDTMNGIHFVNDTLTTIWTTCTPMQPLLVGGAVLLVAGMIVKRN